MAPLQLQNDILKALQQWVRSLPPATAATTAIYVSGIGYSPRQVLYEVERRTDFGNEFIAGLCSLHDWMTDSDPHGSVVDLIMRSKRIEKDHPGLAHAIGTAAGEIYESLRRAEQVSLPQLLEQTSGQPPVFDWAVGWLAREENKIAITLEGADFRIRLERRRAKRAAVGVGSVHHWRTPSWPSSGSGKRVEKDHYALTQEIGSTAGDVYRALQARGELPLPQLQEEIRGRSPVFGWAIGWLAREGSKVAISLEGGEFRIRLERRREERIAAEAQ
jgi:hypothetical protein